MKQTELNVLFFWHLCSVVLCDLVVCLWKSLLLLWETLHSVLSSSSLDFHCIGSLARVVCSRYHSSKKFEAVSMVMASVRVMILALP